MSELRRLLESSDDEFERALVDAVRADGPSPRALRDTALALGLTASTASALAATLPPTTALGSALGADAASAALPLSSGAAAGGGAAVVGASGGAALGTASLGVLGKSLLGGTLVSFLALTTLDQTVGTTARQQTASSAASSTAGAGQRPREVPVPTPVAAAAPAPALGTADAAPPRSPTAPGPRRAPAVTESAPIPVAPSSSAASAAFALAPDVPPATRAPSPASLAAEIRLLDRARAALAGGDTKAASRLLDDYASSRPSSVLTQEAALLRVRLLLAQGRRPAAVELARRIIALHPESAHADSLRRLAAEP